MGNGESIVDNLKAVFSYNIVSLMFIFTLLFIYGIGKDYILYNIYELAVSLQSQGMFGTWVADLVSTVSNVADIIPQFIDLLWLLLTITLFIELIIASYYAEREGWFSSLGFMTFGILFFLFMMGVFSKMGIWFQANFITNLFSNVSYATPFLNFYLNNLLIVNLAVVVLCIVANFVDLDISGFESRKDKESNTNEVL